MTAFPVTDLPSSQSVDILNRDYRVLAPRVAVCEIFADDYRSRLWKSSQRNFFPSVHSPRDEYVLQRKLVLLGDFLEAFFYVASRQRSDDFVVQEIGQKLKFSEAKNPQQSLVAAELKGEDEQTDERKEKRLRDAVSEQYVRNGDSLRTVLRAFNVNLEHRERQMDEISSRGQHR